MSVEAITWALGFAAESATEKAVILVLANYADGDGVSFPGQQSIAKQASCTDRTVRRVLDSLEQRGIISRTQRRRRDGSRTSDVIVLVAFQQPDKLSGSESQADTVSDPTGHSDRAYRTACPNQPDTVSGLTTFEPSGDTSDTQERVREGFLPSDAELDGFLAAYPEGGRVNTARETVRQGLGRLSARLGVPVSVITGAAVQYAARIAKHNTTAFGVMRWLTQERALVAELIKESAPSAPPDAASTDLNQWRSYVGYFNRRDEWMGAGPNPDQPGCLAPAEVLAEFGYAPGKPDLRVVA